MSDISLKSIINQINSQIFTSKDGKVRLTDHISVTPVDENLTHFRAEISGPPGTEYEGRKFHVSVKMPHDYPSEAPNVRFVSKISHPNVDANGEVCNKVIRDWQWCLGIVEILRQVYKLLKEPVSKYNWLDAMTSSLD